MTDKATLDEMKSKLGDRPDLLKRLNEGDSTALVEILDYLTGAKAANVTVRALA